MKKTVKLFLYGLFSWLVPFFLSLFFFGRDGRPQLDIFLVKSVLLICAHLVGTILLVVYLDGVVRNYIRESLLLGSVMVLTNWALDALILLPLSQMGWRRYVLEIGLRYLILPITALALGYLAARRSLGSARDKPGPRSSDVRGVA